MQLITITHNQNCQDALLLLDGGSARNDTHTTPASEQTNRCDLPACSRNKSNFLFKGEKQSSLFTTDSNVFQGQNKTNYSSLLIADSRSFQGKRSPVLSGCFFFLLIWLGGEKASGGTIVGGY